MGPGDAHAVHTRRHRRRERLCQRHGQKRRQIQHNNRRQDGLPRNGKGHLRPGRGKPGRAAAGLLLRDRPNGSQQAGQRRGQPVSDGGILYQRRGEEDGGAHSRHRAGAQQAVRGGDRPSGQLLPRRGIPPELPRKKPHGLLPHTAGRDRAFLKAQDRPRRLRQARGGGHTG